MRMLLIAIFAVMFCSCNGSSTQEEQKVEQVIFSNYMYDHTLHYVVDTQTRLCYAIYLYHKSSILLVDCKNVARIPEFSKHITWVTEDVQ